MDRRDFLKQLCLFISSSGIVGGLSTAAWAKIIHKDYDAAKHYYGMGIDVDKCIGCGRCMQACKTENDVPSAPLLLPHLGGKICDQDGQERDRQNDQYESR